MAAPVYRIYYGKYLDQITNEIPTGHIRSLSDLSFRIEPGKPAEPTIDQVSFTLENFDWQGNERYDDAWFAANSRTEGEGASLPDEIFFRIELDELSGLGMTGIYARREYGSWRETVTIHIESVLKLVSSSKITMLKAFQYKTRCISDRPQGGSSPAPGFGGNDLDVVKSIDGETIDHASLIFELERADGNATPLQSELAMHLGWDNLDFTDWRYQVANTYVQIEEVTLLTRVRFIERNITGGVHGLYVEVWHNNEDPITSGTGLEEVMILPRGQFRDANNEKLAWQQDPQELVELTIYEPDRGNGTAAAVKEVHMPPLSYSFLFGCPVEPVGSELHMRESSIDSSHTYPESDIMDLLESTLYYLNGLFEPFYDATGPADLFDISRASGNGRHVFRADLLQFGWMDNKLGDILVNLAMQTNSYVFVNESGKIVFQHRLYHEAYLPGTLPPGTFEVDIADIRPQGDFDADNGFDSYEIEYRDRIEIDNVESDKAATEIVDQDGVRSKASLRSSDVSVGNYRSHDLGVPAMNDPVDQPLFRYSPGDNDFPILSMTLWDFIPTARLQAQRFARSWTWPVRLWIIEWSMDKYPGTRIGAYFWVNHRGKNRVYFIRTLTYAPDSYMYRMEVQEVGEYNG